MTYHLTIAGNVCFDKWQSTRGDEQAFYSAKVDEYDLLLARFDAVLQADTSDDEGDEDDGRCLACGADLDAPSSAGAEDGLCGECIDGGAHV